MYILILAVERGRWWIVGSAWTGTDDNKQEKHTSTDTGPTFSQKLLELARKQRMNTDTRRNVFCSLMTAEVIHSFYCQISIILTTLFISRIT